ncbi:MAG: type III-B CRISPR module-associated protein Cmr5 [Nitrospirae bacterium]|nr:type III-B CRISPR module-associated protein Cmr5 [Nitrospirota bacterium]
MHTRSQEHARIIHDRVSQMLALERTQQKRYGALCHRFPHIVRENGLAAAFGFLAAKGGADQTSPEYSLLCHYAAVLGATDPSSLCRQTVDASLAEYRWLTRRSLAAAEWFVRFAESVLKVDASGIGDEDVEASHA